MFLVVLAVTITVRWEVHVTQGYRNGVNGAMWAWVMSFLALLLSEGVYGDTTLEEYYVSVMYLYWYLSFYFQHWNDVLCSDCIGSLECDSSGVGMSVGVYLSDLCVTTKCCAHRHC